jgi:hypothetical protein
MESLSAELSEDDLVQVGQRIDVLADMEDLSEDQAKELKLLQRVKRRSERVASSEEEEDSLREELLAVRRMLVEARVKQATHFRSHGKWDEEAQSPSSTFAKSSSFYMGDDWTSEEKKKLWAARLAVGLGTLGGVWSLGGSILRFAGTIVGYEAADERFDGDNSTVNELLRDQAGVAIGNEADGLLNVLNTAVMTMCGGVAGYYLVSKSHSERIDALNRPQATKDVEDFAVSAAAMKNRLQSLQARLADERHRLREAKDKLEARSKGKEKK